MHHILPFVCLAAATALSAQSALPSHPAAPPHSSHFENRYISLQILPGWTLASPEPHPGDCCAITLTHGRYVLSIDPIFDHAGPVEGGRFSEIVGGEPAVNLMTGQDLDPEDALQCAQFPFPQTRVNREITLEHLYTGTPATQFDPQAACPANASPHPVWFGSYFGGVGPESDYKINLSCNATEASALPRKDSPELAQVLGQVVRMLRTLRLKPPVVITKIVPASAPPGATVTVYGAGFILPGQRASAVFTELPNSADLDTRVAPDGKSLTFVVPAFLAPDATYHLSVVIEGVSLWSNALPFSVTAQSPTPVRIILLSPAYYVRPGDFVTLRGSGFTPTANTVHIGSVVLPNLSSADGAIRFPVPDAASAPFDTVPVFVSNANGVSNVLTLARR